jgi:hypothetical protein
MQLNPKLIFLIVTFVLQGIQGKDSQILRFGKDGTFKIAQFADLHYGEDESGAYEKNFKHCLISLQMGSNTRYQL